MHRACCPSRRSLVKKSQSPQRSPQERHMKLHRLLGSGGLREVVASPSRSPQPLPRHAILTLYMSLHLTATSLGDNHCTAHVTPPASSYLYTFSASQRTSCASPSRCPCQQINAEFANYREILARPQQKHVSTVKVSLTELGISTFHGRSARK
jgi:hypothetical protein